ncbi:hypothetical protein J437_LFUL019574 [Ladona fulva]|nr:hypothetical protein J437_LFUL019574 [Ladona fulva]
MELRQKWSDERKHDAYNTKVRFEEVFDLAPTMERAENEVQGSESVAKAVQKVLGIRSKGSKVQKSDQDSRSPRPKECECHNCGVKGHFQKKRFKKGKPKWKIVKCIHNEGSSENGEASDSDKLGSVTTVHGIVQRAKILVHINGRPLKWNLTQEQLSQLSEKVCGSNSAVQDTDTQRCVCICTRKPTARTIQEHSKASNGSQRQGASRRWATLDVRQLFDENGELFEDWLGKIKGHKAVLHLKSNAKSRAVAERRVPFAIKCHLR